MRLTRKLLIALNIGMLTVLATSTAIRVHHEIAFLEHDMRSDARAYGRLMASEAHSAFERGGLEAARSVMQIANKASGGAVLVRWVRPENTDLLPSDVVRLRAGEEIAVNRRIDGDDRLLTYVPVVSHDGRVGAVEIGESLAEMQSHLRHTLSDAIMTAFALMIVYSLVTVAIGYLYIGKPAGRLMDKVRRIGDGDLTGPLHLKQKDELANIAVEINRMCDQLTLAHERTRTEMQARLRAFEQLRHADRLTTVGKLAAGVAHELGTPLNVVGGRAQMVVSGEAAGDEAKACARVVVEQTKRMTAIVRQLLDFSRAGASNKTRADVKAIVGQTADLLRAMANKHGVELAVDLGLDREIATWLDPSLIQQALTNIIVNAIQAEAAAQVRARDPDRHAAVRVSLARQDGVSPEGAAVPCVRMQVRDAGGGMDAATKGRIFEPFFTTKGVGEGTGLGLSVAFGIVRDHGGWIDVDSEPGAGTDFSVFLPISAPGAETGA